MAKFRQQANENERLRRTCLTGGQLHQSLFDQSRLEEDPRKKTAAMKTGETTLAGNLSLADTKNGKRSDDIGAVQPVLDQMAQKLNEAMSDIQALKNVNTQQDNVIAAQDQARGASYIRWGHASCPDSSELVYTGLIGGSDTHGAGGAANHLCLTSQPVLDDHVQPHQNGFATVHGSEYQTCPEPECNTTPACAVCRVARASTVMIPGTNTCTPGWTLEYSGYIMADVPSHTGSSEYVCVDSGNGYIRTTQTDDNENLLYYVHIRCGALPCPPYEEDKFLTCVVCSK